MKNRIISLFVTGLMCTVSLYGQSNIVTNGGTTSGPSGSATYTVGQVFYAQVDAGSNYLIQGMQQPYEISTQISVEEYDQMLLHLSAYPNPTSDILILSRHAADGVLTAGLFDASGKEVSKQKMSDTSLEIDMSRMAKGTYYLQVSSSQNQLIKSFKILKN